MSQRLYAKSLLYSRRYLAGVIISHAAARAVCDADEIRGDSLKLIQRIINRANGRCPFGRKNLQGQYGFMVEQ